MANVNYTLAQFMAREATASVSGVDTVTVSVANATELTQLINYLQNAPQVMIGFGLNINLAHEGVAVTYQMDPDTNSPVFYTVNTSTGKPTTTVYSGPSTENLTLAFYAFAQKVDPSIPALADAVSYLNYVTHNIPYIQQMLAQIMNDAQPIVDDMGNYVLDEDGNMTFSYATLNSIAGLKEAVYQIFSAINGISGTLTSKVSMEDYFRLLNDAVYQTNEDGYPVLDENNQPILISAATPNSLAGIMALVNQLTVDYQAMDAEISDSVAELRQDVIDNMNSVYQLIGAPSQPAVMDGEEVIQEAVPATGVYVQVEQLIHQATLPIYNQIVNMGNAIAENGVAISSIVNDAKGTYGQEGYEAPTTNSIAGLKAALAALYTVVSDNDSVQTQALADAEAALNEAIQTVATNLTAAVAELEGADAAIISDAVVDAEGNVTTPATTNSIAGLKAALAALETIVDENDADIMAIIGAPSQPAVGEVDTEGYVAPVAATGLYATIDNAIATAVASLTERMDGIDTAIENNSDAITTIQSDLNVLAALVGAAAGDGTEASGIFAALADLQAQIDALGTGSLGQNLGAVVVDLNKGDKLPVVGANDTLTSLTIKGFDDYTGTVTTFLNLSDIPSSTTINFIGRSDDEIVQITASSTSTGNQEVTFDGGAGNDFFVVVGARDENGIGVKSYASALDLTGGAGSDTLVVVGEIDLSQSQITGFENLSLKANSPSNVTLTAAQLAGFDAVTGTIDDETPAYSSVITLVGAEDDDQVDLSEGPTLTNVSKVVVGDHVNIRLTFEQLSTWAIEASANAIVDVNLTNITLTKDLDISGFATTQAISIADLAAHTLTMSAAQIEQTIIADMVESTPVTGTVVVTKLEDTLNANLAAYDFTSATLVAKMDSSTSTAAEPLALAADLSTADQLIVTGDGFVSVDDATFGTTTEVLIDADATVVAKSDTLADIHAIEPASSTAAGNLLVTLLHPSTDTVATTQVNPALNVTAIVDAIDSVSLNSNLNAVDTLVLRGERESNLVQFSIQSNAVFATESGAPATTVQLDNAELLLSANQALGFAAVEAVSDTAMGSVIVTDTSDNADFSHIHENVEFRITLEGSESGVVNVASNNLSTVDDLILTAYSGTEILQTGANTFDLTTSTLGSSMTIDADLGTAVTITANQANKVMTDTGFVGISASGAGTVNVQGLEQVIGRIDLSNINATTVNASYMTTFDDYLADNSDLTTVDTLTVSGEGELAMDKINWLQDGSSPTLTVALTETAGLILSAINASQLAAVTGASTNDVTLNLTGLYAADYSHISAEVNLTANVWGQGTNPVQLSANLSTADAVIIDSGIVTVVDTDGSVTGADLGSATVTVNTDATLSLSAVRADVTDINGEGAVTITALEANAGTGADYSNVTATNVEAILNTTADTPVTLAANLSTVDQLTVTGNGVVEVNGATFAADNGTAMSIESAATVNITADDLAGLSAVDGEGAISITGVESVVDSGTGEINADFSAQLANSLDATVSVDAGTTGMTFAGNLTHVDTLVVSAGNLTITDTATLDTVTPVEGGDPVTDKLDIVVEENATVTLLLADLTERSITGNGSVAIGEAITAEVDISNISANLNLNGLEVTDIGALTLTAAQADGAAIVAVGSGGTEPTYGSLTVTALEENLAANLGALDTNLMVTAELDSAEGTVTTPITLSADLSRVDRLEIAGTGVVSISQMAQLSPTAEIALTGASSLYVLASMISGLDISGAGTVYVTGTATEAVDLSTISANIDVTGATFEAAVTYPDLASTQALTLTEGQATVATLADSTEKAGGLVTVVGLSSTTNLSGIDAGNTVTVMVNASIDATENVNLDNADRFTVAADQTLTLTGAQVSVTDRSIDGFGSLTVTAVDANTSFAGVNVGGDLAVAIAAGTAEARNSVDLSELSLTGVDTFAIGDYATLTLTAEQATGASITGSSSTAVVLNGSVETAYTGFDIAADVDATLAFTNTGVVNAASDFTGIDHLALAGDGSNGAAPQTTMTAAQANGKDFVGSTGGVIIIDSAGNQEDLVGTEFNDRFEMDISKGFDTIDLSAGGTDTIALSQSGTTKNGKTVEGFDAGTGGDVLDFSALNLTSVARQDVVDATTGDIIRAGELNPDAEVTTASTASETFDQNQDLSGKVVILDNTVADSTSALQTAFSAYAKFSEEGRGVLNDGVDEGESKVFITDSAGDSTNVFVWADTSDVDVGAVQASESALAVDLVGVAVTDITIDNVVVEVVGQPTGGEEPTGV